MSGFNNTSDLYKTIMGKVNNSLKNEVAEKVKEVQSDSIQKVVYEVYSPKMYKRRGNSKGLSDIKNMKENLVIDDSLNVTELKISNETPFNGENEYSSSLARVVVTGVGYNYFPPNDDDAAYLHPRDFVQDTELTLIDNKDHVKALKESLKKKGLKVK